MAEYLSKETLQEKLNRKNAGPANKRYTEGWNDAILMVKSMVHCEKAADVEPVRHGKWLPTTKWWQGGSAWKRCSECGILHLGKSNFCPNCGAKMDLEG